MTDGTRIERLCRPTATRLRSSLVIPSLPQVLTELAHNALDAGATRIECWVNLVPGDESARLEDDGHGIGLEDLGIVGQRYSTSKETEGWSGNGVYGFRGEALASIAALSLMEISSREPDGETYSKIVRNGQTIYLGKARHDLGRAQGTTIFVRDLFHAIPVRRASLAAAPASSLTACRQAIEALVLVAPKVRWTLWEDKLGGMRKALHWGGGKNSTEAFRGIYGHASVERVLKIRVSSGDRRMDGFISLEGAFTKAHQHLYINGYSVASSELRKLIERRFAASQFSALSNNLDDGSAAPTKKRPSPRRLERFPVYVLNISLPSSEVDAAYDARKSTIGYKQQPGRTRAFVIAVIDDFLRKNGFGVPRCGTDSPVPSPSKPLSPRQSGRSSTAIPEEREPNPARRLFLLSYRLGSVTPNALDSPPAGDDTLEPEADKPLDDQDSVPMPETEPFSIEELLKEMAALETPGVREVVRRWGIGLDDTVASKGEYTQVNATCVPKLLDARLGRKNPTELTRLLRLYLPELADHISEIQVLTMVLDRGTRDRAHSWASVQRWMPQEMVELANSKACRGAIMFEDRLDTDQCERLVGQLGAARNPWICAHGRPTLAPLTLIPQYRPPARRPIDWAAWKRKHFEQPRPSAV
ncbi:hypothetical protein CcaverHIS002_0406050 [Cutaneotrichosporon cavernicola]|nr:hypothetical protein CcaverHIS002_0406050 [Cutaneotrichosporon cavernicola]